MCPRSRAPMSRCSKAMAATEKKEQRVLVLAPTGRDASLIGDALRGVGVQAETSRDMAEFARMLEEGAAAGLLAEEALDPGSVPILIGALRGQPAWSDFPIVLMTSQRGPGDTLAGLSGDAFNITLLERPVRMQTLTSVVQGALRQRRRQYDRDWYSGGCRSRGRTHPFNGRPERHDARADWRPSSFGAGCRHGEGREPADSGNRWPRPAG